MKLACAIASGRLVIPGKHRAGRRSKSPRSSLSLG